MSLRCIKKHYQVIGFLFYGSFRCISNFILFNHASYKTQWKYSVWFKFTPMGIDRTIPLTTKCGIFHASSPISDLDSLLNHKHAHEPHLHAAYNLYNRPLIRACREAVIAIHMYILVYNCRTRMGKNSNHTISLCRNAAERETSCLAYRKLLLNFKSFTTRVFFH